MSLYHRALKNSIRLRSSGIIKNGKILDSNKCFTYIKNLTKIVLAAIKKDAHIVFWIQRHCPLDIYTTMSNNKHGSLSREI